MALLEIINEMIDYLLTQFFSPGFLKAVSYGVKFSWLIILFNSRITLVNKNKLFEKLERW